MISTIADNNTIPEEIFWCHNRWLPYLVVMSIVIVLLVLLLVVVLVLVVVVVVLFFVLVWWWWWLAVAARKKGGMFWNVWLLFPSHCNRYALDSELLPVSTLHACNGKLFCASSNVSNHMTYESSQISWLWSKQEFSRVLPRPHIHKYCIYIYSIHIQIHTAYHHIHLQSITIIYNIIYIDTHIYMVTHIND